jgi:hypothetical protein
LPILLIPTPRRLDLMLSIACRAVNGAVAATTHHAVPTGRRAEADPELPLDLSRTGRLAVDGGIVE